MNVCILLPSHFQIFKIQAGRKGSHWWFHFYVGGGGGHYCDNMWPGLREVRKGWMCGDVINGQPRKRTPERFIGPLFHANCGGFFFLSSLFPRIFFTSSFSPKFFFHVYFLLDLVKVRRLRCFSMLSQCQCQEYFFVPLSLERAYISLTRWVPLIIRRKKTIIMVVLIKKIIETHDTRLLGIRFRYWNAKNLSSIF